MKDRKEIEEKLGVTFKNPKLLKTALIHRSYINEHRGMKLENNERLEFLGDAVLELIISSELFRKYPKKPEGELTAIRSAVVRTESLAQESRILGIGEYILMSKGEEDSGGKDKDFILANTYEAILGAIYLDQGIDVCKEFVKRTVLKKVHRVVNQELFIDPKT
ncbi:MAG TPA: ribonuclease III, partial [Candidatus Dojkabacteria bacterium]|nr:ribonuclease III [Candidatus Dojkabacteria bacterium]